jgi:Tfp pilus assembly protein PilO
MAKKTKNLGGKILFFILGMLLMLGLDMIFHFNNSVEKQLNRELNKAERKIEDVFKNKE